jgi:hypothetical protein
VRPDRGALLLRNPEASDVAVQGARIDAELLRGAGVPIARNEPKNLFGINGLESAPPPPRTSCHIREFEGPTHRAGAAPHLAAIVLTDT